MACSGLCDDDARPAQQRRVLYQNFGNEAERTARHLLLEVADGIQRHEARRRACRRMRGPREDGAGLAQRI